MNVDTQARNDPIPLPDATLSGMNSSTVLSKKMADKHSYAPTAFRSMFTLWEEEEEPNSSMDMVLNNVEHFCLGDSEKIESKIQCSEQKKLNVKTSKGRRRKAGATQSSRRRSPRSHASHYARRSSSQSVCFSSEAGGIMPPTSTRSRWDQFKGNDDCATATPLIQPTRRPSEG